jgi:hypothetical protein
VPHAWFKNCRASSTFAFMNADLSRAICAIETPKKTLGVSRGIIKMIAKVQPFRAVDATPVLQQ